MLEVDSTLIITYEERKKDPHLLLLLINKYVNIYLVKNLTICGLVHSIDPIDYSIIILEVREANYQTTIVPGHAIINVEEMTPGQDLKIPTKKSATLLSPKCYLERKEKILLWFKENLLSVTESDDNIIFGNVLILPPYGCSDICTDNPIVAMQVINILKRMPGNY